MANRSDIPAFAPRYAGHQIGNAASGGAPPIESGPETDSEAPLVCAHCGLPTAAPPVENGLRFCCVGCEIVHSTLHRAGLGHEFYRLREIGRLQDAARPARTEVDPLLADQVDSDWFLAECARPGADGSLSADLNVDGVHCAACLWLIEQIPSQVTGVVSARLNLPRGRLTVCWEPGTARLSQVIRWLAGYGYQAHPLSRSSSAPSSATRERKLLVKLGVAWALAGNVMLIAFAMYSGLETAGGPLAAAARWLSLVLAVPAVLYGGSEFYSRAFRSIGLAWRTRSLRPLHMDVPITLGVAVGFLHSALATWHGANTVWFDSITVLIAALLTARWLQERSRRVAADAADRLLSLIPSMARRVSSYGQIEIVRTLALQEGDVIEVPAEEIVPADGVVISGASSVNNAVLTGESRPMSIVAGSEVHAGAMNLTSTVRIRISAAGDHSRVGKLLAWMKDPDVRRAPVVMLADRIGGYFVSAVVLLALATAVVWLALDPSQAALHAVALLVITCPCALGMATPLAMTVAVGRAARAGVFIKNEGALQELNDVDVFVLDKTGTLTEGRPAVVDWFGDQRALELAASLERQSHHVLARAVTSAFPGCRETPSDVKIEMGSGISGRVAGNHIQVGRPSWVSDGSTDVPEGIMTRANLFAHRGLTPVAVAVDGSVRAVLAFGDPVRASAAALVAELKSRGLEVYLASGDDVSVARDVGTRLRIPSTRIFGQMSPEDKLDLVRRLQSIGSRVAVLGDGVNDAAALRIADVGIAVGGGASASLAAADIFLMQDGLAPVVHLLHGSGRVMRTVRRNLTISLAYNVAGAAAALLGLVTPLLAAVAMPVSSLIVVGSSILQRSFSRGS